MSHGITKVYRLFFSIDRYREYLLSLKDCRIVQWVGEDCRVVYAGRECSGTVSVNMTVHKHSASDTVEVSFGKFFSYAFACFGYSGEHDWSPPYLINALGRVEIFVLPLPSRVRTTVAQLAVVWFYYDVHSLIVL